MSTEPTDLFHAIREGNVPAALDNQFPFFPLDAPGMPLPGPNFVQAAMALGDPPVTYGGTGDNKYLASYGPNLHYLYRRALYDEQFQIMVDVKGNKVPAATVPGHLFCDDTRGLNGGPRQARVMLIGKHPGREEIQEKRNFVGPTSAELFNALEELGVSDPERAEWYCTNLVKWTSLDRQSDTMAQAWKKDCAVLLEQEIRLVKPDFILCLGSDASKALLGPSHGVESMVGRVMNYNVSLFDRGQTPVYHTAKVMAVTHPAAVHRRPELFDGFKNQLGLFLQLINGGEVGGVERFINHRVIYKARELERLVEEIRNDPDPSRRIIAVDGEWHGEYPGEPGAYLRTVQFSSKHGEGITVVLRHQGGTPAFQPSIGHAVTLLNRLLKYDPPANYYPRIGGHFFRADMPWLIHEGIDLRAEYMAPATAEQYKTFGGWDTGLQYHSVNETASYRLTDMMVRLTTAPLYDTRLNEWKEKYCKERGLTAKHLEGYGMCPAWVLHPQPWEPEFPDDYAGYDADVTRRIAVRHLEPGGMLDRDWFGNSSWEPNWVSQRAAPAFLEMEMNGIMIDKDRVDKLTLTFMQVKECLLANFRARINWPEFNPESAPQCVAFLFGDQYSNKRDKQTGQRISIRPPGALSLGLMPIKTTGKRSKLWPDVVAKRETEHYNPSADKEVLGILGHEHRLAMQLRDLKFITQVLKSTLRPPVVDDDTGFYVEDDDGNMEYDVGLASCIQSDGRVRTHLSQNKETGRASSARPPLQNISKRREGDYRRILGYYDKEGKMAGDYFDPKYVERPMFERPLYEHPIRSIFCATPGHVLVEADLTGAELAVIAWMSGDPTMIEHVRRNALPEDHPDHYDMHSQTAVNVFRLPCAPTKAAMKAAKLESMRVAAKNVNFGIPYGRSAEAIARQCREEGVHVTPEECQMVIEYYFNQYPLVQEFLTGCQGRSQNEQWMAGCFGRMRRFIRSRERSVIGEQQRQAQNFPIQNTVADAVSRALDHLYCHRWEDASVQYRLLLQIHDAILYEVPIPQLRAFIHDEVNEAGEILVPSMLRQLMVNRVPIWPRYLDNTPMPVQRPYFFGIDKEVCLNWGEHVTKAQAEALGIDPALI